MRNNIAATETSSHLDESEHRTINIHTDKPMSITNLYCPNSKKLNLNTIPISDTDHLVVGNLNTHSSSWGYPKMDSRGEDVEEWMIENNLILINNHDDEPSYYSRSWRSTSTRDLAMATETIQREVMREVTKQLGGSDHKPISLTLKQMPIPDNKQKSASWNYKQADWDLYTRPTEQNLYTSFLNNIVRQNANQFTDMLLTAARRSIPRGRRHNYQPFWS